MFRTLHRFSLAFLLLVAVACATDDDTSPAADAVGADATDAAAPVDTAAPDIAAPEDTGASADIAAEDIVEPPAPDVVPDDVVPDDVVPDEVAPDDTAQAADEVAPPPSPAVNRLADEADLDYLVVTTPELADAFAPFVEWKRAEGYAAQLVTTAEIYAEFPDGDEPTRIRAYLQDRYATTALRWVLLGGDHPALPRREVHVTADVPAEETFVDTWAASELWYADLDGDWDADGDGTLAEPEDALDFVPELYVGRLPVDTPDEVATYLAKVVAYQTPTHADYQDRVLFLAEWAGYGPTGLDIYSSGGFEAFLKPLLPSRVQLTRLYEDYETYPGSLPHGVEPQRQAFADGHALVMNFGHGNVPTLCKLWGDEILTLADTGRPAVYWTCECYSGMFDSPDEPCGGELYLRAPGGGVLFLGNSDFGVGFPSVMNLMVELTKGLYATDDTRVGPLLHRALARFSSAASLAAADSPDRFTALTYLLLGDPSLRLWTGPARVPTLEAETDGDDFTAHVTAGGAPVADATVAVYAAPDTLYTAETDAHGEVHLLLPAPLPAGWTATVLGTDLSRVERH